MSAAQRQKQFDMNRSRSNKLVSNTSDSSNDNNTNGNTKNVVSPHQRKLQASMERLQVQQPNTSRRAAGSNWMAAAGGAPPGSALGSENNEAKMETLPLTKSARTRNRKKAQSNRFLAMDCEMVGVGPNGQDDMLARVSIVNKMGQVLLDKHVKPRLEVTDYRTSVSGIRPHDIANGEDFATVQNEVVKLLHGRILVGHALGNDLAVLSIHHPFENIRDTSRYKPLRKIVSNGHTPSLKRLTMAVLGKEIQTGEHNSVEDARAAMSIYNRIAADWEKYLEKKRLQQQHY